MSIKVRVSYERPDELKSIIRLLHPVIKSAQIGKGQTGKYKRAYLFLEVGNNEMKH